MKRSSDTVFKPSLFEKTVIGFEPPLKIYYQDPNWFRHMLLRFRGGNC